VGKKKKPAVRSEPESPKPAPPPNWISRHSLKLALSLVTLATIRIVATYPVFNHTCDEPAHVACGMEWLEKGIYRFEPQHPPLARVAVALGPYLAGAHLPGTMSFYYQGADVLYFAKRYVRNLTLARIGVLPFFWIAALVVWIWARRYQGDRQALLALFLFTFLPPVLAHAGLATTDMALTAFVGASFLTALWWLEQPSFQRSLLFGAATGLAVLSKFSALAFIPASMGAALVGYLAIERPKLRALAAAAKQLAGPFCIAVLTGALVIWAGYRFSFDGIPAPELWQGIGDVFEHNRKGHIAYLLGSRSDHGFWYYYPVILAVKTPFAFLALLVAGCAKRKLPRAVWLPLAFSLGILVFGLFTGINIGVRHVLPVYIGFSLVAAAAAAQATWARLALAVGLAAVGLTSLLCHPDYLPYFNLLAGSEPEKIAVDSDLDWGQDINRLSQRLREVHAPQVTFNTFIVTKLESMHGFPPTRQSDPQTPSPGWNAVSLTVLKVGRMGLVKAHPEYQLWPEHVKPQERVGKGIWLYYFPQRR